MKYGVLAEPVLVGRERELEELTRCFDSVLEGRGKTVFISGEAGSGKTKLVNEFLKSLKGKDMLVLSSWCLSDVAVPYMPFMQAFSAYFTAKTDSSQALESEEVAIKAWLGGPKQTAKSDRFQNLTPQAWQDLAVAAVTQALLSISTKRVVVLFIDDLQWADSASLALLHYVSRSIGSARVLLLVTYRSEELNPDTEGCPHPLLETLRLIRREGLLNEIKLLNLDQVKVSALAEKMIGGSLHPELAGKLSVESQGNPLFVVESLRMLCEHGSLVEEKGRWRLTIDEVAIPGKIKDIILRRIGMLKLNERRILDLASVIGEKFDVELLGAVLGQDCLLVLETLNAVAQSSSLVRCEGNYYEFDHAKSREAIYEQISPPLRKGYHARVAEKMEVQSKGKDLPVNDLSYHYTQAGNKEKSVEYALAAGDDALAKFSNTEASKQFNHVLAIIGDSSEYTNVRTLALEGLGDALNAEGLFVDAMKTFEKLSTVAESGVVKLRALRKALACSIWEGNREHSVELRIKAEEFQLFDRLEYARLRLYGGFVADRMGNPKEAFEDMDTALRVFEEEYSLRDVANALAEMVLFYVGQGRLEDQFSAALRSINLYEELEDLRGQLLARSRLDWPLRQMELYDEALRNIQKGVEIGEKVGDYNATSLLLWATSVISDLRGDFRGAVAQTLKALKYAEKTNAYLTVGLCYGMLVREYAKLGDIEHAEEFDRKRDELYIRRTAGVIGSKKIEDNFFGKSLLLSAKGQFNEANKFFEDFFKKEDTLWGSGKEIANRNDYAWVLEEQGRHEEAMIQLKIASKLRENVAKRGEKLEHANVLSYVLAQREVGLDEELNLRIDLVNVAKKPASLVKVEELIPLEFRCTNLPSYCSILNSSIKLNGKELGSFTVLSLKLSLQAKKAGIFTLTPKLAYVDDTGQTKTSLSQSITINVHPTLHIKIGEETTSVPILPNRLSTGYPDLDALLCGGIPEKHAITLTSPSIDEEKLLVRKYLETGTNANEPTFYVTTEAETAKTLVKKHLSNFYLIVCNSQVEAMNENLPNVFKLKGIENLTEINIALIKAFRTLEPSANRRRICLDITSDVLLHHHAVVTRKWLTGLLPNLKSQGFTVLATINPYMHSQEEVEAIVGLFDGEIRILEKETTKGTEKVLKIRRLFNEKFLENEINLNVAKLK